MDIIDDKEYSAIYYNETKFHGLSDLSYGHDALLVLFHLLFEKYPLLGKIISDKYDYIFIDEYQDTQKEVLCDILTLSQTYGVAIGLFGDNMQSIYPPDPYHTLFSLLPFRYSLCKFYKD